MDLHDAKGNINGLNGAMSMRGRDSDKDSDRGVLDMHRNSGMSGLEGASRGTTKDVGGIEHENREGSGSGLQDESGGWRPGGTDMISQESIVSGDGRERVSSECDVSGIECAGKHTGSGLALSAEGGRIDSVSREESGLTNVTPSV
jgi:hypothetical protein